MPVRAGVVEGVNVVLSESPDAREEAALDRALDRPDAKEDDTAELVAVAAILETSALSDDARLERAADALALGRTEIEVALTLPESAEETTLEAAEATEETTLTTEDPEEVPVAAAEDAEPL